MGTVGPTGKNCATRALLMNDFGEQMDVPVNGFSFTQGTLTFWYILNFDLNNLIGHGSNSEIVSMGR